MDSKRIPKHMQDCINYTVDRAISIAINKFTNNSGTLSGAEYLSAEQAAQLLKIKLSTLYSKVESGDLPHYRSGKRKLLFARNELLDYISNRRCKSNQEIAEEVENYIISKKLRS